MGYYNHCRFYRYSLSEVARAHPLEVKHIIGNGNKVTDISFGLCETLMGGFDCLVWLTINDDIQRFHSQDIQAAGYEILTTTLGYTAIFEV